MGGSYDCGELAKMLLGSFCGADHSRLVPRLMLHHSFIREGLLSTLEHTQIILNMLYVLEQLVFLKVVKSFFLEWRNNSGNILNTILNW